jgi:hypothetical protein
VSGFRLLPTLAHSKGWAA